MDTALLVARAAGGDLDSFGQIYDASFNRVYDFAWRLLRDADAAGAVTRRVFEEVVPALPRISAQGDFASWLLLTAARDGIAHADATATKSGPRPLHEEAFGAFDVPDPCRLSDPALTRDDYELACLVWDAAMTLGARDYAALDLHVRQGLDAAALAPILGVPRGSAAATLDRLRRAADEAMQTYVLARRGGKDCEPLRRLLIETGFPPYADAVRTAVDAHAAACATCRNARVLPAPPSEVLKGFVPVQAPFVLKGDAWRALVTRWPSARAGTGASASVLMARSLESAPPPDAAGAPPLPPAADQRFGGSGGDGGPPGLGLFEDDARRNVLWFAGAAVGMLAVAFVVGGIAVGAFGIGGGGGGGAAATPTSTPSVVSTPLITPSPGVVIDTPTPAPTPSPAPSPTVAPPAPPTATPSPRPTLPPATPTRVGTATSTPGPPTPGGPPTPTPTPRP